MTAYKTDEGWLNDAYDSVNPAQASEGAYLAADSSPPETNVATLADALGTLVVLMLAIDPRTPQASGDYRVFDHQGRTLGQGTIPLPGVALLSGLPAGTKAFIQPLTKTTMAKLLTPEHLTAAGKPYPPPRA